MQNFLDSPWIQQLKRQSTCKGIAIISGLFSLIVAVLLVLNFIADQSGLPEKERIYSAQLVEKKELLSENPQNEILKEEIRQLDMDMRQSFFERLTFADQGKYLLLIGVVIFILSMKQVIFLPKPKRKRKSDAPKIDTEGIQKKRARWAVTLTGIVVLGTLLPLAYGTRGENLQLALNQPEQEPAVVAYPTEEELKQNWPRFRGYGGLGIVYSDQIPTYWNEETGENILWKKEIPLPGNNSPIVWGDRVFLTGGTKTDKEVYCFSAQNGEMLWQNSLNDIPVISNQEVNIFEDTGYASSTMACDGQRVFAIFADGVMAGYTLEGERLWAKHLGVPENMYGFASSLICYRHKVIVQYDQGDQQNGESILYALDGETGQVAWQAERQVGNTWTTPIVIDTEPEKQLITCAEPWVISYNPESGEERWRANLLGVDLAPSPIFANNLVLVIQPSATLFAIRPDGQGDVTESHVEYILDCPAPEITSPVSNGELLFMLSGGYLACHNTNDGEFLWEHDLADSFTASPTLVGDWIYMTSEEGTTYRVKAASEIEMDDRQSIIHDEVHATPAFQGNKIFIRSHSHLYGIGSNTVAVTP